MAVFLWALRYAKLKQRRQSEMSESDSEEDITTYVNNILRNISTRTSFNFHDICMLVKGTKNFKLLKQVLNSQPSLVKFTDHFGETLLMKALKSGNFLVVFLLLVYGSDPNDKDNRGFTTLYFAILKGDLRILNLLFEFGADTNGFEFRYKTPLSLSLEYNRVEVVNALIKRNVNLEVSENLQKYVFIRSIILECHELIDKLLKLEIYVRLVNERDESGKTPLINACDHNSNTLIIEKLLNKFASMSDRDRQGRDAMFAAAQHGKKFIVDCLIKHNYKFDNINLCDSKETDCPNAIFAAIVYNPTRYDLISTLVKIAPVEVLNHVNKIGNTILHLSAELNDLELFNVIKNLPIDKQIVNLSGETADDIVTRQRMDKCSLRDIPKHPTTPGKELILNYIERLEVNYVRNELKNNIQADSDHVLKAVMLFDSLVIERDDYSYCGDPTKMLRAVLEETIFPEKRKQLTYTALVYSFILNKFKVVHQLFFRNLHRKMQSVVKKKWSHLILSFDMIKLIENYITVPKTEFESFIGTEIELKDELNCFYAQSFSRFYYEFVSGLVQDYCFDHLKEFKLDRESLEKAIDFRREDIATVILQHGYKLHVDEPHEQLIKIHFSASFNKLYFESKGEGLLSLEQFSRIEVRKDRELFHEYWQDIIRRPVLQFDSKFYDIYFKDHRGFNALDYSIQEENYTAVQYLLNEMEL